MLFVEPTSSEQEPVAKAPYRQEVRKNYLGNKGAQSLQWIKYNIELVTELLWACMFSTLLLSYFEFFIKQWFCFTAGVWLPQLRAHIYFVCNKIWLDNQTFLIEL